MPNPTPSAYPRFPHDTETQNTELRKFVKKVATYSNDGWLAREADELIILYGDPDAKKPQRVIHA